MKEVIFPKSLKKGDSIAIISPAGAVLPEQLEKGINMIESQGFQPVLGKYLYKNFTYGYGYAGSEKERLHDLNHALNDSNTAAIWASRGGYGCQHLLKGITLKNFKKNPKWYIGYSDNTVLQSYLLRKNFASIHGQTVKTSSFGVSDESYQNIFKILSGKFPDYKINSHQLNREGSIKGQLVGGNLALIYALLGTKYSFDFKDKILFIEDIGENFYALDRMLITLELAGIFGKIKGLIVGGMTNMGDEKTNAYYENSYDFFAYRLISDRIKKYRFPVIYGFPNGHIFENLPVIIGALVNMESSENASVKFIDGRS